jgi:hypothetical protein
VTCKVPQPNSKDKSENPTTGETEYLKVANAACG